MPCSVLPPIGQPGQERETPSFSKIYPPFSCSNFPSSLQQKARAEEKPPWISTSLAPSSSSSSSNLIDFILKKKNQKMKNVSKWSLCFRPPATIEIDDGVDCSADRMLSLIAAARNSNRLNKKKKKQETKKSPKTKVLESSIADHHPPPRTYRRSFSSVVKAFVLETSLSRKVRESKSRNRSDQSVRVPPSDQEPYATADWKTSEEKSTVTADLNSGSNLTEKNTSTPPASDFCFTPVSESEIGAGSAVRINPVVCLILLSLWVTVFWGRACAVMTTTLGIYAWQSGVVVVGLGEMLKLKKDKKKRAGGAAMEEGGEIEKGTDNFSAKGNKLIERGLIGN